MSVLLILPFASWGNIETKPETITLVGLEAQFHPMILDLLQGLAQQKPPESIPLTLPNCTNDEWLSANTETLNCERSPNLSAKIQSTRNQCRLIANPLDLYLNLPIQPAAFSDTTDLKSMLRIFASPVAKTQLPASLLRPEFKAMAESITLKVFAQELSEGLSQRREILKSLKNRCAADPHIDLALNELESAEQSFKSIQSGWTKTGTLPVPELTANERKMLTLFLSSMTWRARGGGLYKKRGGPLATQELRMKYIWNSYSTILELLGAKSSLKKEISFSLYVRGFRGWHDFWDMGTNSTYTLEEDFRLMTERGLYQVAGALSSLQNQGLSTKALELAGRQMGACYLFGWHGLPKPPPAWGLELKAPLTGFAKGPTSWGELCFGAALGLGLAETFQAVSQ